jgi:Pyruvate phosphate dikinase, AMP/ATP-binding domain
MIAARLGHSAVSRTETVKFLIDLEDEAKCYFLDTVRWNTHFEFIRRYINPLVDYKHFIVSEYTRADRRFILGSLTHYIDGDHWAVELDAADNLSADRVEWMLQHLRRHVLVAEDLRFRPVSPGQIALVDGFGRDLPSLPLDVIQAAVAYQPVVLGVAFGYLRIVRGAFDVSSVRPYDIVLTDQVPIEIPPVAALITSQLQAPLAHVAVLSRNRNTPDMALRNAVNLPAFAALEGCLVKLTVGAQEYEIARADHKDAEAAWAACRPTERFCPTSDLEFRGIVDLSGLSAESATYVGAKAAQLAQLADISGVVTPGGFVVPFSAYAWHLEASGAATQLAAMLDAPDFRANAEIRAARLKGLREAIAATPVD